jgi:hypothetical protein
MGFLFDSEKQGRAVLGVVGALVTLALSDGCCGRVNQAFAECRCLLHRNEGTYAFSLD